MRIFKFIKGIAERYRRDSLKEAFLGEVERYRPRFQQGCINILGKDRAEMLSNFEKRLLPLDSYLFDPEEIKAYITGGLLTEENNLFSVISPPAEIEKIEIDSDEGGVTRTGILGTCPVIVINPEVMKQRVKELREIGLPASFTPWLHEYCHFIGYCLQERPLMVAISILYIQLLKRGYNSISLNDMGRILDDNADEVASEIAQTIVYLHWLDEDMAHFLQELILEDLGFDTGNYFVESLNLVGPRKTPLYQYDSLKNPLFLRLKHVFWALKMAD